MATSYVIAKILINDLYFSYYLYSGIELLVTAKTLSHSLECTPILILLSSYVIPPTLLPLCCSMSRYITLVPGLQGTISHYICTFV